MITSKECLKLLGDPEKETGMLVMELPIHIKEMIPCIPAKIYCNHRLKFVLLKALTLVVSRKLQAQVKTWDGCFNIRKKRGAVSMSLHSWGLAIDINAAWNGFGKTPTMSPELVACFTDAGFEWGGKWSKPDGMHFQLAKF